MEKYRGHRNNNPYEAKSKEIFDIENKIINQLPIDILNKILPPKSYLIGGSIRDVILGKPIKFSDLDVYTRANQDEIINTLVNLGYSETFKFPLKGKTFYFEKKKEYLYFGVEDKRVEVRFVGLVKIEDLISLSDINLNCCAYDIHKHSLVNKKIALSIKSKRLEFSNPELARKDPFKVFSALKQVARLPDINIPPETEDIIKSNIQKIYEYYNNNPDKKQDLKKLLCEINSTQVLNYFNTQQQIIFKGLERKPLKLVTSADYSSFNLGELSDYDFNKIHNFVREKYGKRFDPLKIGSRKVNSAVLDRYENQEIRSCCLFDGLRLYAIASSDLKDLVKMVKSMVEYNYSIWTTISADHEQLIKLSVSAGLQIERNKETVHKILSGQYSDYLDNIKFNERNNYMTFTKIGSNNPEQVLLRS